MMDALRLIISILYGDACKRNLNHVNHYEDDWIYVTAGGDDRLSKLMQKVNQAQNEMDEYILSRYENKTK
jgi:uncharacterized damage-inducible protein DinB